MNFSINALSLLSFYSFSPIITGYKVTFSNSNVKNFFSTVFYNPESLQLDKSYFIKGFGSIVYKSSANILSISDTEEYFGKFTGNYSSSSINPTQNYSLIIIRDCQFKDIIHNGNDYFILIDNKYVTFYMTGCIFHKFKTSYRISKICTNAAKITHICFSNIERTQSITYSLLIFDSIYGQTFTEFIYSSACNIIDKDTGLQVLFNFEHKSKFQSAIRYQCNNVTNAYSYSVIRVDGAGCNTFKMNTFNLIKSSTHFDFDSYSIYFGITNFVNINCSSIFLKAKGTNSITFDNCIFKNNRIMGVTFNSGGIGKMINCVFDSALVLNNSFISSNCDVINNPKSHVLAHFTTEYICLGVVHANAYGCHDGNCSDKNGCSVDRFQFGPNDIVFTEKYYEGYNTRIKTPSPSNKFSNSVVFTSSLQFSSSNLFSKSNEFSHSNLFSKSNDFSHSNLFSKSNDFPHSNLFSKSNKFSFSDFFTNSQEFTLSKSFTPTNSNIFTKSLIFSASDEFTKSLSFLPTPTQSLYSHAITYSVSYSFSYVMVRSVDFNYSTYFVNSFIQTYINGHLTYIETNIFTDTKIFYIIYFPSITMLPISLSFEISYIKKKITPEKLIGIICGSVAAFFSIIGIIFCIINKQYKKYDFSSIVGEDSISSDYSENQEIKEVSNVNITEVTNDNFDNWL